MATSVLLSIKPEFVERILNGSKQFEFRRRVFKRPNVSKIVIYATAPISKVIGEFEIEGIIESDIEYLWQQTHEFSGIQKSYFEAYFDGLETGYAIRIGKVSVYEEPLSLQDDLNVKRAPQSFVYVNI
jgi:predicted transcriptional regulator